MAGIDDLMAGMRRALPCTVAEQANLDQHVAVVRHYADQMGIALSPQVVASAIFGSSAHQALLIEQGVSLESAEADGSVLVNALGCVQAALAQMSVEPQAKTAGASEWVVGFLFDEQAERVVLIRKNRPKWQAGKLNGIGGRVEPGESIFGAMQREFREEAGLSLPTWHHFASLTWEEGIVHFMRQFVPSNVHNLCHSLTDERVETHWVHALAQPGILRSTVIPNLLWLVPLAAHRHDDYAVVSLTEIGTTLRKVGRSTSAK